MDVIKFREEFEENFKKNFASEKVLFEIDLDKVKLYEIYLDSFPEGTNEIYRERREMDCNCCRRFTKEIGNVVTIKNNKIISVWDFEPSIDKYKPVVKALSEYVHKFVVTDIKLFRETNVGVAYNYEKNDDEVIKWDHLFINVGVKFVSCDINTKKGELRDSKNVLKRSLDELTEDSVVTVLELIKQGSLYKGNEWESVLAKFLTLKEEYSKFNCENDKSNFCWKQSTELGVVVSRIRNHSIGQLLIDLSEEMALDTAVARYEKIVAPANYKRPKELYTERMWEEDKKIIQEKGYMDSLSRRYAQVTDITINNLLFADRTVKQALANDIFSEMDKDISRSPKKFSKVEEIGIEDFTKNVLPTAKSLEVYFENKLSRNMVSLIAPRIPDSKTLFKWDNCFSWAYTGNLTDSDIKQNVKNVGAKVDGVLRFSIQWNDRGRDNNDLDAHCVEPDGDRIHFRCLRGQTGGELDYDTTQTIAGKPAVENIIWENDTKLRDGEYHFAVHNFSNRGGRDGFRAEIEFDGQIYSYDYKKEVLNGQYVSVATVLYNKTTGFTIKENLKSSMASKEIWGLNTNQFVPVSAVMLSPNYWDEQNGIGNKHYLFMMKDCVNPEKPNSFYNEFLNNDILKHKRVAAALGSKAKVDDCDNQLSGVGFSSTLRNDLIVKVKGNVERVLKIKI